MSATFSLIKPDANPGGSSVPKTSDLILEKIQQAGFKIERMQFIRQPTRRQAELHLIHLQEKNEVVFLRNVVSLMGGPVLALELSDATPDTVENFRKLVGPTDPADSQPGHLRNLSDDSIQKATEEKRAVKNLIHAADSPEAAQREIQIWMQ